MKRLDFEQFIKTSYLDQLDLYDDEDQKLITDYIKRVFIDASNFASIDDLNHYIKNTLDTLASYNTIEEKLAIFKMQAIASIDNQLDSLKLSSLTDFEYLLLSSYAKFYKSQIVDAKDTEVAKSVQDALLEDLLNYVDSFDYSPYWKLLLMDYAKDYVIRVNNTSESIIPHVMSALNTDYQGFQALSLDRLDQELFDKEIVKMEAFIDNEMVTLCKSSYSITCDLTKRVYNTYLNRSFTSDEHIEFIIKEYITNKYSEVLAKCVGVYIETSSDVSKYKQLLASYFDEAVQEAKLFLSQYKSITGGLSYYVESLLEDYKNNVDYLYGYFHASIDNLYHNILVEIYSDTKEVAEEKYDDYYLSITNFHQQFLKDNKKPNKNNCSLLGTNLVILLFSLSICSYALLKKH